MRISRNKVSCVIPAFNEGGRISYVLNVVKNHPLIDEVIVVNDGSRDNTREVVKKFKGVRLLEHERNEGYTKTLIDGLKAAKNDIVFILDADAKNLKQQNVSQLILPVVNNESDVSLSLRNNPFIFRIIGIDFATGERVLNKKIMFDENIENVNNWSFMQVMNDKIIKHKYRVKVVDWTNVVTTKKSEKLGFFGSIRAYIYMWYQFTRTIGVSGWFSQTYYLRKLKV